ncbi:hypothetical protein MMC13_001997 [Lambiella insularis]|nr:hypothetical protein [Lambiella insularis]
MTHLATLSVLRLYFLERPRVRAVRLVGMIVVLGLLIVAEFMPAIIEMDSTLSVQSALQGPNAISNLDGGTGYYNVWNVPDPLAFTWLTLYLLIAYGNNITSLYHADVKLSLSDLLLCKALKKAGVTHIRDYQGRAKEALESTQGATRITRDNIWMLGFFFNELLKSFLWQLMFVTFGFAYGLLEVCMNRWIDSEFEVVNGVDPMGFGQIVTTVTANSCDYGDRTTANITKSTPDNVQSDPWLQSNAEIPPIETFSASTEAGVIASEGIVHHADNTEDIDTINESQVTRGNKDPPSRTIPVELPGASTRTAIADGPSDTDEALEPRMAIITRNRGTERSIGIELEPASSSRAGLRTSRSTHVVAGKLYTPLELESQYLYGPADRIITLLIFTSYFALATFAVALSGFLPMSFVVSMPRAALPLAAGLFAGTTLLIPTATLHAEAPSDAIHLRKPIYDDRPPRLPSPKYTPSNPDSPGPSLSPSPTDRLATQIGHARLFLQAHTRAAEAHLNAFMTRALHLESSFTSTIASLAPPPESHEHLLPSGLYVLVAAMAGSIVTRNRNILLRASVPLAVGVGAAWVVLPYTMRNVGDLVWKFEERAPVVAMNHMRVRGAVEEGWRQAQIRGERVGRWAEERVSEGREAVEGWVRKGR